MIPATSSYSGHMPNGLGYTNSFPATQQSNSGSHVQPQLEGPHSEPQHPALRAGSGMYLILTCITAGRVNKKITYYPSIITGV